MPFLFKITSPTKVVSYLFGTIHKNEDKFCLLSSEAKAAFEGARVVVTEKTQEDMIGIRSKLPAKIEAWRQAQSAHSVSDYLSYAQLKELIELFDWGKLSFDEIKEKIEIPPIMLSLLLTDKIKTSQQADTALGFFGSPLILDDALSLQAQQLHKKCVGLDTEEEYLSLTTGGDLSYEQQVQFVHETFKGPFNLQKLKQKSAELEALVAECFLAGDLEKIQKTVEDAARDAGPVTQHYSNMLVAGRDKLFAERLERILQEEETFIAIGSMHLPGVMRLLRERGFQIELVSEDKQAHPIREMKNTNAQVAEDQFIGYFNAFRPHLESIATWQKYSSFVQQGKLTGDKPISFSMDTPVTESACAQIRKLLTEPGNPTSMDLKFVGVADDVLMGLFSDINAKSLALTLDLREQNFTKELIGRLRKFVESYPNKSDLKIYLPSAWELFWNDAELRSDFQTLESAVEKLRYSGSSYRY